MAARAPARAAGTALAVLLLAQVPALALGRLGGLGTGAMGLVAISAAVVLVGQLTFPARERAWRHRVSGALAWPILLGAGAYLTMALHQPQAAPPVTLFRLAAGVAVLGFFLDRLTSFAAAAAPTPPVTPLAVAPLAVLLVLGLAASGPLWLGPWAEYLGANQVVADTIIACNPLTFLAVLADYDYLRNQWFYAHTPFGGLRYSYPGQVVSSTIYLTLGLLLWIGERARARHKIRPA